MEGGEGGENVCGCGRKCLVSGAEIFDEYCWGFGISGVLLIGSAKGRGWDAFGCRESRRGRKPRRRRRNISLAKDFVVEGLIRRTRTTQAV